MDTEKPKVKLNYVFGLDLGQSASYSTLVLLEYTWQADATGRLLPHFALRFLKRWQLGTSYTVIVADVVDLVKTPPIVNPLLGIDRTGVGAAVTDMFRVKNLPAHLMPVLITAGFQVTCENGCWHVPKKELVSVLQRLLQERRLKIANIPERDLLVKELSTFKVKITANANESFESWRERDHDDLVLSCAIACWLGSRSAPMLASKPLSPEPSPHRSWMDRRDDDRDRADEPSRFEQMLSRLGRPLR